MNKNLSVGMPILFAIIAFSVSHYIITPGICRELGLIYDFMFALLLCIIANQIYQTLNYANKSDIDEIREELDVQKQIRNAKHPYLKEIMKERLKEINSIFNGTYVTTPYETDKFFPSGLEYTENNGTIKATKLTWDYYTNESADKYLSEQKNIIKKKDVTVVRIFFLSHTKNDIEDNQVRKHMNKEFAVGKELAGKLQVRCIPRKNYGIIDELEKDFFIQDDKLLIKRALKYC